MQTISNGFGRGPRGEIVDGWETKRRREPGHDWALIRLGAAGIITGIDVDTSFFTGNFPTTCRIEACGVEGYQSPKALQSSDTEWIEIVTRSPLKGDAHNRFDVSDRRRFTHVRLSAFPDGGISRVRLWGEVDPAARRTAGYRWFNALPGGQAAAVLADAGVPADLARSVVSARPLRDEGSAKQYQALQP
ncbi:hypothetical protein [Mesorhizobium sp. WSM4884]|uniref:hypothetical protein n=1 Tax=Mesorhizobium sp. WSM4884 TaxID=3038542 RepID=UPI002416BDD9|nr:hypothetical protein [Mesorhizobium sp. WSM4884]MDG4881935.1 hypothetical protein [Mesorhizobium sp. WSM4884]